MGLALAGLVQPVAIGQGRGAAPEDPDAPVFRVVRRDGTQEGGTLVFQWGQYAAVGDRDEAAEEEPQGGGGGRGGGGGAFGNWNLIGAMTALTRGDLPRDLWVIDRIEQDAAVVLQANESPCVSEFVKGRHYGPGHGDLEFDLPEDKAWSFVSASADQVIAVRRDASRDIVGRVRLWFLKEGDGKTIHEVVDADLTDEVLFLESERDRFLAAGDSETHDLMLPTGLQAKRHHRFGEEKFSGAPLHLEANVFKAGPTIPVFEILARGDQLGELLLEARGILDQVRFNLQGPVGPKETPKSEEVEGEAAEGRGGPFQLLRSIEEIEDNAYFQKGKYTNDELGVEMRAKAPGDWVFTNAHDHGFMLLRPPVGGTNEMAGLLLTTLDGIVDPEAAGTKDGPLWILDRYLAELIAGADGEKLKPKKVTLGGAKGQQLAVQQQGARGPGPSHLRIVIETRTQTLVVVAVSFGSGSRSEKLMDEVRGWLKSMKVTK